MWRVNLTITRSFKNRADALSSLDSITAKVPGEWTISTEECKKER